MLVVFPPALPLDEDDEVALEEQPPPLLPPPLSLDEDDVGDDADDDVGVLAVVFGQHCGDDDDKTKEGRVQGE